MDTVHRLYCMRGGIQRVNAQMRTSGVSGFAVKIHHHRRRSGIVHCRYRLAHRTLFQRPEMEAEQHLHVVQYPGLR